MCKTGSGAGRNAAHFRAVDAQRGALTPDVRSVAPASVGCPIWPAIDHARPCECLARTTHITAAVEGACWHHPRPERLRLALCRLCRRMCASQTICWDMSSSRRELALGADVGSLVLSWNHSKSTPCLLVRHQYRHTNHHAAASPPFKFPPAPLGVTHETSTTRPATSTIAPPCPSPTRRARWAGLHARSRTTRASHLGSSSSRRHRWCVVQDAQELPGTT